MNQGTRTIKGLKIVFYDGECAFCSFWVSHLLKLDEQEKLYFAPLKSSLSKSLKVDGSGDIQPYDSILYYDGEVEHYYSQAVLKILEELGRYKILCLLIKYTPHALSDWVYKLVSKLRYHFAGNAAECKIPSPEKKDRFLV